MPKLEDHPLAACWPLMSDAEIKEMAADIDANGLTDPIWLYEGKILDGRNRYRACQLIDYDHRVEHYRGKDPLAWVKSKNNHRRHLTASQRSMVAANLAKWQFGQNQNSGSAILQTRAEAAQEMNVSERSVADAAKVKSSGVPELVKAVEQGEATVHSAATVATLSPAKQQAAVASGTVAEAAKKAEAAAKAKRLKKATDIIGSFDPGLRDAIVAGTAGMDEAEVESYAKARVCGRCYRIGRPVPDCPGCAETRSGKKTGKKSAVKKKKVAGPAEPVWVAHLAVLVRQLNAIKRGTEELLDTKLRKHVEAGLKDADPKFKIVDENIVRGGKNQREIKWPSIDKLVSLFTELQAEAKKL